MDKTNLTVIDSLQMVEQLIMRDKLGIFKMDRSSIGYFWTSSNNSQVLPQAIL